jgi:hypothetical protein
VGGAYSDMLTFSPYIDTSHDLDYAEAYVQFADSGSNHASWGWQKTYASGSTSLHPHIGYSSTNGWISVTYNTVSLTTGSSYTWTLLYNNCGTDKVSITLSGSVSACELTPIAWTPSKSSVSGGVSTRSNQMPGGYNNMETMPNGHVYYSASWHPFNGTVASNNDVYFGDELVSSTQNNVYDNYCSS